MKNVIYLLIILAFTSCEKEPYWEPLPEPVYEVLTVQIDSIVIWPDTLLEGTEQYLHIKIQHRVLDTRDSVWRWCDLKTEQRPVIYWGDHKAYFNLELCEPRMAVEIKPATCPGTILGCRVRLGDSLVRYTQETKFIRVILWDTV